jgi:hypothetical protein
MESRTYNITEIFETLCGTERIMGCKLDNGWEKHFTPAMLNKKPKVGDKWVIAEDGTESIEAKA